jgi:quinone-modifying oxidoreductase, subunit QmoB
MDNVGVFLCTGCEIGAAVNTDELEKLATEEGAKTFFKHDCLCSVEGVAAIHKAVDEGTNGILIAACSSRVKVDEFRFDPMKVSVERMSLREQVAWSHPHGDEDTQMLAEDLLRMSMARIKKNTLPTSLEETIDRTVLVVGGGVAGLNAALAAANLGNPVVLVDSAEKLGGYMAGVKDAVPERPPYNALAKNEIGELVSSVENHQSIRFFGKTKITRISGQPGQFNVDLETPSGAETFMAGAIVQATGSHPYDASKLTDLGFGASPDVITSADLESMITGGELKRPSDGALPKRITFIQCAGSRNADHLPYCSSECCVTTLRHVNAIKRDFPSVECAVIYRDMRAPGQLEHFYLATQEQSGCMFTRGENTTVEAGSNGAPVVKFDNKLLGEQSELQSDMVVLAVGMVPNSADSESIRQLVDAKGRIAKNESETQVKQATELAESLAPHEGTEILNLNYRQGPDLPVLRYNFPDSHYICFPYETRRTGIYAAGTLRAPMDASQAAEDGWGAAFKAVQCIHTATHGEAVHPRAGDVSIADFFLQRCTQCKRCTEECPFGAINEDEKGTPQYNPLRCRRCGTCLGACPERIINFPEYSVDAVGSMIKAMEVPDEDEEKPRILVFMCENDAVPAMDEAAARGMSWNPWMRIIPVRCLGAVNVIWIADAMSGGIDGVLLLGCKKGDDYQCHYMTGSELANTRMANVGETLDRLSLESERVRIVEIARNEFDRIPQIFEEFAEKIDELGPNPMKGF